MQKPSIAIIVPGGIGTGKDNIGVPVLERIVRLLAKDFSITVFQLFPRNKNFEVHGFEMIDVYSTNLVVRFLKFFFVFRKAQRERKFQAVHGFWVLPGGFLAVVMGKLFKIKSIVSVLGGDAIALPEIQYGQLQSTLYRKLIFWTLRNADEANALTQYLVNNLSKAGFAERRIKVIPWGIDTALFAFRERQQKFPIQFLHIGNLHPVKDQETLLRTFKIVSDRIDAQLTIIGEGIFERKIVNLIGDLSLQEKVTIVKQLPYESLPAYYYRAEILLHTSRSEGQSEVVTEAMSSGLLICGTNVGLIHDLPEFCISVEVGNHKALAAKILDVMKDQSRIRELCKAGAQWTKSHSIEWTVKQLKELYQHHEN